MIKGTRIILRAVEDRDVEQLRYWRNHPQLINCHFSTLPVDEAAQRVWYNNYIQTRSHIVFIVENEKGESIGYTLIKDIDHKNRNCEIGIYLDPGAQGKGYGKDGFLTLTRFCFHELNMHRVFLTVYSF